MSTLFRAADLSGVCHCDATLQEFAQAVECLCVSFGTRASGFRLLPLPLPL